MVCAASRWSTEADTKRVAKRLSLVKAGAIAFSTELEPESGDAEPPVLSASYGAVPEGVLTEGYGSS